VNVNGRVNVNNSLMDGWYHTWLEVFLTYVAKHDF